MYISYIKKTNPYDKKTLKIIKKDIIKGKDVCNTNNTWILNWIPRQNKYSSVIMTMISHVHVLISRHVNRHYEL